VPSHPHLIDPTIARDQRFTSPKSFRETFSTPPRNRQEHAEHLRSQLESVATSSDERVAEQKAHGVDVGNGVVLTFQSDPDFPLKIDSLEATRSGIELLSVRTLEDRSTQAQVFVPDGKVDVFLNKVISYRDKDTTPREEGGPTRPKNQDLVESIADIKLAVLEALWTDLTPFPPTDDEISWEIWLRRSDEVDHLARLRAYADALTLQVGLQAISFIDRTVVLVRGKPSDLSRSVELLSAIAEVRSPQTSVAFFTEMTALEQEPWVSDLAERIQPAPQNAPYISLFDTGLNGAHPLLSHSAAAADLHTYKPAWGLDDRRGHGTPMAGLALFGDLIDVIQYAGPVQLTHRLESVKIYNAQDPHEEDLYGAVTQESAYRVEVTAGRRRVYCMAVSSPNGRERGRPTSWSAAIDALASGAEDNAKRLIILSAGNTDSSERRNYPNSNFTDSIHDPGQAWNALTVGGYTDKYQIDATKNPGWLPLAERGDLAPCSCTSSTWTTSKWPIKPDIVLEAGNMAKNPEYQEPDYIDNGLQLLSTAHNFTANKPLTAFGDTSAATALAAQMAARVWAKYPDFTPETVRAMLVHSSSWTPKMLARFTNGLGMVNYESLLRTFGYGVPNLQRLLSSANNSLTLIAQGLINPFFKEDDRIKTREMRVHALKWPAAELLAMQNAPVTMRTTLAYFVEPSPGRRGIRPRYGYQSHGLRFAVKTSLETTQAFERRINKAARDEEYDDQAPQDAGRWLFGHAGRSYTTVGSIHSDVWTGRAADLATKSHVAIFPTLGWWSKRPHLEGWEKEARYSLVVTVETPSENIDIYTPVANQIGVPVVIET